MSEVTNEQRAACDAFVADLQAAHAERKIGDGTFIEKIMAFLDAHPQLKQWGLSALIALLTGGSIPIPVLNAEDA